MRWVCRFDFAQRPHGHRASVGEALEPRRGVDLITNLSTEGRLGHDA